MALLDHDLRRGVAEGPGHGGEDLIFGIEHLGNAKVGEDKGGVVIVGEIEEVFWFQVYRERGEGV
jgi:hypothetical protein